MHRILLYTHEFRPFFGGIANFSYSLAKYLARIGQEVYVLAPKYEKCDYRNFDESQEFTIIRDRLDRRLKFPFGKLFFGINKARSFTRTYTSLKPDIVMPLCGGSQLVIGFLRKAIKSKIVTCSYGSEILAFSSSFSPSKHLFKGCLLGAHQNVAISQFTKKLIEEFWGGADIQSFKVKVIYPGLDTEAIPEISQFDVEKVLSRYNIDPTKNLLVTIARLDPRKGQDLVIKALSKVDKESKNVQYVICGEGPREKYLINLVKKLDLLDKVKFLGRITKLEKWTLLKTCDIVVQPNRVEGNSVEGFGILFLEGAYMEKPVIAGNSGGAPEAVLDGKTGFLVDPYRVDDLIDKLNILLGDKKLRKTLGKNARARCKEFDWNCVIKKWDSLIKAL